MTLCVCNLMKGSSQAISMQLHSAEIMSNVCNLTKVDGSSHVISINLQSAIAFYVCKLMRRQKKQARCLCRHTINRIRVMCAQSDEIISIVTYAAGFT